MFHRTKTRPLREQVASPAPIARPAARAFVPEWRRRALDEQAAHGNHAVTDTTGWTAV